MKIIGFAIKKVSAERLNPIKGKLEIKSGLNVDDIVKEEVNISDKDSLRFDFTFSIDYSPEFAKIEVKGSVVALDENEEVKEILKEWKKKKFDHKIKLALFNFILEKCNLKAVVLEEELGLPFHIPFPKLAPAQNQQNNNANYAG